MEEVLWEERQEPLGDPGPDGSLDLASQQDLRAASERLHPSSGEGLPILRGSVPLARYWLKNAT